MAAYNASYANRGQWLEKVINMSNIVYGNKKIAVIKKVPTPTSPIRRGKEIVGMKYTEKSTVDFVGVSRGTFIAFDAKETKTKNLPFKNIENHQLDYLQTTSDHGGHCFLLIYFDAFKKCYKVMIHDYVKAFEQHASAGRKSIPYAWFEANAAEVKSNNGAPLDYLGDLEPHHDKENQ